MAARPQGATRSSRARLADRDEYPSLGSPVKAAARSGIVMGPPPRIQLTARTSRVGAEAPVLTILTPVVAPARPKAVLTPIVPPRPAASPATPTRVSHAAVVPEPAPVTPEPTPAAPEPALVAVTAAVPEVSLAELLELSTPETITLPGLAGRSLKRRPESAARALPLEAVGSLDSALSRKAVIERTKRIVEQGRRRQILLIAASVVVIAGVLIGTLRYAARADAAAQPNTSWNQIVTSTPSGAASVSSAASASTATSASPVTTTAPAVSTAPTTATSLPSSASSAMTTLTKNAIYGQSLAVESCPSMAKPNTDAEAQQAISRYVDCMNDVWGKILAASNKPFRDASVEFFVKVIDSPCDRYDPATTNAVYCLNNMTLYVSGGALGKAAKDRAYAAELVTHEYAHHVQSLSGIINAAFQVWGPSDEYSRRIEMHAHCLSFALITHVPGFGVTSSDLSQFRNGWARGPDNAKFGSIASQQAYGEKGLAATKVGDCDAFSAPTVS